MTHHHLGFKILNSIKSNADHNQYGSTAEAYVHTANAADKYRKYCDNTEEQSSDECYS